MTQGRRSFTALSIYAVGERRQLRVPARRLVHVDAPERVAEDAVVDRPAPAAHGLLETRPPERRRVVERGEQPPVRLEPVVDLVHPLAPHEVAAAVSLVEDGRVVEQRLDQEEVGAEPAAELLHAPEHTADEAQPAADLSRGEAVREGPSLLGEIA